MPVIRETHKEVLYFSIIFNRKFFGVFRILEFALWDAEGQSKPEPERQEREKDKQIPWASLKFPGRDKH